MVVASTMAGLLGWGVGRVIDGVSPWTGGAIATLVALGTSAVTLVRPPGEAGTAWRRAEIVGVAIGAAALQIASGGADRAPLVAVVVMALVVRSVSDSTMVDVDLVDRVTDDRVGAGPVRRIRNRVVVFGALLAAMAGFAEASRVGLFDLDRGASTGLLIPLVLWYGLGMVGVGAVSLRARRWRWDRDGYEVAPEVSDRWIAGIAMFAATVMVIGVATPLVSGGASALPAQGIANAGGVGRWVSDQLDRLGDTQAEPTGSDTGESEAADPGVEAGLGAGDPPEWLGDAVVVALVGSIFLWAIRAGRRAVAGGPPSGAASLTWRDLFAIVRSMLGELLGLLARVAGFFHRLVAAGRGEVSVGSGDRVTDIRGVGVRWTSEDSARLRAARAFARVADLVDPRPGETPTDVADGLAGDRSGEARTVVDTYRRARYSQHPIPPDSVERAERAADAVVEHRTGPHGG